MKVLEGGKFSDEIPGEVLSRGLRPSKRMARNTKYLIQCSGAVGRDRVLQVVEDLENDRIDTSIITDSFPYPQIFVLVNMILVCGETKIYSYSGTTLTLEIDVGIAGTTWTLIESYDYIYMSNCAVAVIRNPQTQEFSISSLPPARAMCNYNGQVIISECYPEIIDLYILRTGYVDDPYPGITDTAWIRDHYYNEDTHYGSRGSGIDQLYCAGSISVDDDYVFIADFRNNRMMVRSPTNLSYLYHVADFSWIQGVHTNNDKVYVVGPAGLRVHQRSDFTELLKASTVNGGVLDTTGNDLTVDDKYVYVANTVYCRVDIYDKDTLEYIESFGRKEDFTALDSAIYSDGTYVYTCPVYYSEIRKTRISDWYVVDTYGGPDHHDILGNIYEFSYSNGYIYTFEYYSDKIYRFTTTNLELTEIFTFDDSDVTGESISVDSTHVYIGGNVGVLKYTIAGVFVASSGDFTYATDSGPNAYSYVAGVVVDSTYLYVFDWGATDIRIIRRLKSDLSYVDEYTDSLGNFNNPSKLYVDDTYVYVVDQGASKIHRLNKSTMAYVDSFSTLHTYPQQISISGSSMYVATYYGFIDVISMSTLTTTDSSSEFADSLEDYWMIPNGITCDSDSLYISNWTVGGSDKYQNYIAKYNKITKQLIARVDAGNAVYQPAVDEQFLYVPVREYDGTFNGYMHIYNKSDLSFVTKHSDILCESIDTKLYFK